MIATTLTIVSSSPSTGPAGTIRYVVKLNHPDGVIEIPNVRSHSSREDGSEIDRKAAADGTVWPAFIFDGGSLQACIVEMEDSQVCDDEGAS